MLCDGARPCACDGKIFICSSSPIHAPIHVSFGGVVPSSWMSQCVNNSFDNYNTHTHRDNIATCSTSTTICSVRIGDAALCLLHLCQQMNLPDSIVLVPQLFNTYCVSVHIRYLVHKMGCGGHNPTLAKKRIFRKGYVPITTWKHTNMQRVWSRQWGYSTPDKRYPAISHHGESVESVSQQL